MLLLYSQYHAFFKFWLTDLDSLQWVEEGCLLFRQIQSCFLVDTIYVTTCGLYQNELGAYIPITHMYPLLPAVLEINGTTITSNVRHQLIKAYPKLKYMQYLQQQKYEWNNKTVNDITWKCLNLGLQRIDREVILVKICNNLLPTATILLKWKWQNYDNYCLCGQSETRDHMIRCPETTRKQWRIKTISTLQK